MGAIGGLLGVSGGASGTGFSGPTTTPLTNPTTAAQLSTAYTGNQTALTSQQNLLAALQAQNGLANQSQVYNQLQGVANGTGPNPAQAQLAQATGANVSNQAALMAGQRGAASNVGLIARQAAQQGAATQQNAAGQAATLQAQQSLNAINTAGGIANTQAANQIAGTSANTQAQQAEQANLLNANQGYNTNLVAQQSNINNVNGQLATTTMQGQQNLIGGLTNGAGSVIGSILAEGGEVRKRYADGGWSQVGDATPDSSTPIDPSQGVMQFDPSDTSDPSIQNFAGQTPPPAGPTSRFGKFLKGAVKNGSQSQAGQSTAQPAAPVGLYGGMTNLVKGIASAFSSPQPADNSSIDNTYARGGQVPALVSPGEKYLSPKAVEKVKKGANPMKVGETIPGKPRVGGAKNSYANDTVKKNLQEGGIVVPRSETKSKTPERNSADFVAKVLSKRKGKR